MVEPLPSKQAAWVRFPSPALDRNGGFATTAAACPNQCNQIKETEADAEDERHRKVTNSAAVAQLVERVLGKDEVLGSNPSGSFLGRLPKLRA